jgi:hypothetical protein
VQFNLLVSGKVIGSKRIARFNRPNEVEALSAEMLPYASQYGHASLSRHMLLGDMVGA